MVSRFKITCVVQFKIRKLQQPPLPHDLPSSFKTNPEIRNTNGHNIRRADLKARVKLEVHPQAVFPKFEEARSLPAVRLGGGGARLVSVRAGRHSSAASSSFSGGPLVAIPPAYSEAGRSSDPVYSEPHGPPCISACIARVFPSISAHRSLLFRQGRLLVLRFYLLGDCGT